MKGNGIFEWCCGGGVEPEFYYGPHGSREEAFQVGRSKFKGGTFTIVEADKSVPRFDVFDASRVLEDYEDQNEECWGEDGAEVKATADQERELEGALASVFQNWMEKHQLVKTWTFGTMRNKETFCRGPVPHDLPQPVRYA